MARVRRGRCRLCGAEFEQTGPGKSRKFCTEEHQRQWWIENRAEAGKFYTYVCQNCGKEYQTIYSNRDTCCSRECGWEWHSKQAIVEKECLSCGRVFEALRSGPAYCSDACSERGRERVCRICGDTFYSQSRSCYCSEECRLEGCRRQHEVYMTEKVGHRTYRCQECGRQFVAPYGDKRRHFCSLQCSRRNYRTSPQGRAQRARNRRMRRARKYGNGPIQDIDPRAVYARDGWHCGICGKPVDPDLEFPDPMSATLDHIIPLAQGGTHTWRNVQLAHQICNSCKRDVGGGQLRLGIPVELGKSV